MVSTEALPVEPKYWRQPCIEGGYPLGWEHSRHQQQGLGCFWGEYWGTKAVGQDGDYPSL